MIQGYGFTVSSLYDLLLEIRDTYSQILMRRWVEVFNSIFQVRRFFLLTFTVVYALYILAEVFDYPLGQ